MSEDGCAAIGEFLRRDRRIKVVTLSENSIRDEGRALQSHHLQHFIIVAKVAELRDWIHDSCAVSSSSSFITQAFTSF